jgi:hypothetical protein
MAERKCPVCKKRPVWRTKQSNVCFRQARVNLDFPWPTVILMKDTR